MLLTVFSAYSRYAIWTLISEHYFSFDCNTLIPQMFPKWLKARGVQRRGFEDVDKAAKGTTTVRTKMKPNSSWRIRSGQILFGSLIMLALFVTRGVRAGNEPVHLVADWSRHRHLVFSRPKNLMQQLRLSGKVRYEQQLFGETRRTNATATPGDGAVRLKPGTSAWFLGA